MGGGNMKQRQAGPCRIDTFANLLLGGVALLALAAPAAAQTTATAPNGSDQPPAPSAPLSNAAGATGSSASKMSTVVVTARRRAEDIERVPVAVTALGPDQLASREITSQSDLQTAVPGLTVRETENQNNFNYSIRGQTVDAFSNSRPAVVSYIDDVQLSAPSVSSLYDLASVQVLKGPQGTLFGRNATGGAIDFLTAKPTDVFGGYTTVRLGNLNLREVQAAVNLPIVDDKVLLRLATDIDHRDGFQHNEYDGVDLGSQERQSYRATLAVRPIAHLQNTTVVEYDHSGGNDLAPELYSAYPCGSSHNGVPLASTASCFYGPTLGAAIGVPGAWNQFLAAHPQAPGEGLAALAAQQRAMGPYDIDVDSPSLHHAHSYYVANTTTYDLTSTLQIKNIVGYANSVSRDVSDLDGSPYPIELQYSAQGQLVGDINDILQGSDEFQILGKAFNRQLDYIVGAYYSVERDVVKADNAVFNLTPVFPAPVGTDEDYKESDHAEAVFFQGTYNLDALTGIHGLSFTGGFRYSWDEIHHSQLPTSSYVGAAEARTFSDPSWQVGVQYQVDPKLLLYVENRGSYRAGGFNGAAPATPVPASSGGNLFLPETTYDVEVGAKYHANVFGKPTVLNLALYDQWINNIQRVGYFIIAGQISALTVNIPSADVRGVEFDSDSHLTDWLEVGLSAALTDARYTSPSVDIFSQLLTFGPYADTPKLSGTVFARVQLPTPDAIGRMYLRGEMYAQDLQYFSSLNNTVAPYTNLPGYALLNFRYEWQDIVGTKASFAAFVKNAGDKATFVGGLAQGAAFGANGAVPGEPRTFGVELGYKF